MPTFSLVTHGKAVRGTAETWRSSKCVLVCIRFFLCILFDLTFGIECTIILLLYIISNFYYYINSNIFIYVLLADI